MGFFDSILPSTSKSKLTNQEAFAGVLLGASACDGHIAEDEVQALVTTLIRMKLYERLQPHQLQKIWNKLTKLLKKQGVDELIDACILSLDDELRATAFTNACDIVLADGVVEPDEKEFIDKLQEKLEIEPDLARLIADVMVAKNKG
jgi:uncharacterized tellurite resistance protein B-like protein